MEGNDLVADLDAFLASHEAELVEFRRDLHANPETGYNEHRTTRRVALRLAAAGLRPVILPKGTGLIVDVGTDVYAERSVVALRADIDALPMADEKNVPYMSTVPGVCHACGHDVHTTILLGTGLFLAQQAAAGLLPGRVRLIFQPSEELGTGALDVLAAGGLASVGRAFALHCDPRLDAGQLGVRTGAITAACDKVTVRVTGPGGHTARPHLTADLVFALGKIVTELPAALSRRVDPRSSLSLVWGHVSAGSAPNAIPDVGVVTGTVRTLDDEAWHGAPDLLKELISGVASAYGVTAELDYERNVPPTVNDPESAAIFAAAGTAVLGEGGVVHTPQSLGGEDFAWVLESVPGALARLGTRVPGSADQFDLHQPTFDVDERAIGVGVKVMAATAFTALWDEGAAQPVPPAQSASPRRPDAYSASVRRPDAYSASARRPDAHPAGAYPAGAYPAEAYPAEAYPPDAYPPVTSGSDAYPAEAYQSEAYPPDAYPVGAAPAEAYQATREAYPAPHGDAYSAPRDASPDAYPAPGDAFSAASADSYQPSDVYSAGVYKPSAHPSDLYPATVQSVQPQQYRQPRQYRQPQSPRAVGA
jgi:amidohydrolase